MARATRASQSYSQSQPSQRNKRRIIEDDDEDEDEEVGQQTQNGDDDMGTGMHVDQDHSRMAHALVRLALFNEQRRMPLRREEITKKVLSGYPRMFNVVLQTAQDILRDTFAMELVELQSRAELDQQVNGGGKDAPGGDKELDEARKATGMKKRAAASGSKSYILRSILDPKIIQYATLTDKEILEKEIAAEEDDEDSDDEFTGGRSFGSIINWSKSDQLGSVGILYVVLALILVNGRVINNMELRNHLKQLKLHPHTVIYYTHQSTHSSLSLDSYLTQLIRQGYIDKISISSDSKKGGAAKRGRTAATQGDDDNAGAYEWRWGIRSQSEIGEQSIAEFISEFMVDKPSVEDGEDGEGSEDEGEKEEYKKKVDRMYRGIERSAGGALQGLR